MSKHVDIAPGPYWCSGMLGVVLYGRVDVHGDVPFLNPPKGIGLWVKVDKLTPSEEWPEWWPFKDLPIPHAQPVHPIVQDETPTVEPAPGPKFDTRELAADGWQLITLGQAKELYWQIAKWSPWTELVTPVHPESIAERPQPGVLVMARPPKDDE